MTSYYIVDDETAPGAKEYDEDSAYEYVKSLENRIEKWDHEDIRELKQTIDKAYKTLSGMKLDTYVENYIDLTDLPSEDIPRDYADYPIWAIDKSGNCLVDDSDGRLDIMDLEEIKEEWGEE